MALLNFVIEVGASGIRVEKPDGGKFTEYVRPNPLDIDLLRVLEGSVVRGALVKDDELRAYGSLLYRTIFVGDVHNAFQEVRASRKSEDSIHIRLVFDDEIGKTLAGLSWEYLHYPESKFRSGFYFLGEDYLTISRLIPMDKPKPENLVLPDSRVHIWIIVSDPAESVAPEETGKLGEGGPVLWKKTVEHVKELQGAVNQARPNSIVVRVFDAPSLESLIAHEVVSDDDAAPSLRTMSEVEEPVDEHPDIIHFIGHGKHRATEGGAVGLLSGTMLEWCDSKTFVELIKALGGTPRLILLQQCESGKSDFSYGFTGIADRLGRDVSPAVVAMQHKILNQDAIDFFRHFYSDLFKSGDVLSALQAGRGRLRARGRSAGIRDRRTFGTPVLHLYSEDAQILVAPAEEIAPPASAPRHIDAGRAPVAEPRTNGKDATPHSDLVSGISQLLAAGIAQLIGRDPNLMETEQAGTPAAAAAPILPSDSSIGSRILSAADPARGETAPSLSVETVKQGQKALIGTQERRI